MLLFLEANDYDKVFFVAVISCFKVYRMLCIEG